MSFPQSDEVCIEITLKSLKHHHSAQEKAIVWTENIAPTFRLGSQILVPALKANEEAMLSPLCLLASLAWSSLQCMLASAPTCCDIPIS